MSRSTSRILFALSALLLLAAGQSQAASVKDFYKSKRVTMLVAAGPGAGYDIYARVLARHMGRHIPGKPEIVVQNMPGAGGLKATNHLATRAPKDGSVILATFSGLGIQPLYDGRSIKYDPLTLNWIGSIGKLESVCVTWKSSAVKTIKDAKGKTLTSSATGARSNLTMVPNLLNELVGTKFKPIIGYTSAGIMLALERSEVDSLCGLAYSSLLASNPEWFREKKVNVLAQITREKVPELGSAPSIYELAPGADNKKVLDLWTGPQEMGRPFVAPPGLPKDRVEALRRAFDATMKDPGFLKEATKTNMIVNPLTGEQVLALIKDAHSTPKEIVEKTAVIIKYAKFEKKKKK